MAMLNNQMVQGSPGWWDPHDRLPCEENPLKPYGIGGHRSTLRPEGHDKFRGISGDVSVDLFGISCVFWWRPWINTPQTTVYLGRLSFKII